MLDGGIRRGTEVIAILEREISISLALMGLSSIDEFKARGGEVVSLG